MHAGLATAHLALVGDVVVDEGCGLEVLYCGRGREGARGVSANGLAAKQHQRGTRALAARAREARKWVVKVARKVIARVRLVGQGCGRVSDEVRLDGGALLGEVFREEPAPVVRVCGAACCHG